MKLPTVEWYPAGIYKQLGGRALPWLTPGTNWVVDENGAIQMVTVDIIPR